MRIQIPREFESDIPPLMNEENEDERIRLFLDVPNWKCECGLVNFGRNERCADPKCQKEKPNDYER